MSFLSFIRKEFYHIFRDRRSMLILLGMPIAQIILFGFAITTEVKNINVAIYDASHDVSTLQITKRIAANSYFNIVQSVANPANVDEAFKQGDISLAIVFEERFNENLIHTGKAQIQFIADATDPNTSATAINYISNIVAGYQQELAGLAGIPAQIEPQVRMLYNPQMKSPYNFVPGVMGLILMLICAMMTSISIVRERETGTMEILLVSPMKPLYIILAKAVPYALLSCVNLASILLLSVFVIDVPVAGSLFWLSLLSFVYIAVSLSLGLLISTIAQNQVTAMLVSGMALMMPTMLLSGMIFPVENMPLILQGISSIIPARWYIAAVRKVMIEGLDVSFILKELGILLAMAVLLITISFKKFKIRLA